MEASLYLLETTISFFLLMCFDSPPQTLIKILRIPFEDYRKIIINLILAPYLVVIKKLSFEESYQIIYEWLQKCDLLRKLDFNSKSFVNTALTTAYKKQIPPIKMITLKTNYKDLYFILVQKEKEERVG